MGSCWKLSLRFACLLKVLTQGSLPDQFYESAFFVFQQQNGGLPAGLTGNEGTSFDGHQRLSKDNNEFLQSEENNGEEISANEDKWFSSSDVNSAEYSDENPMYVLPANEDPSVPSSDVLSVNPLTLDVWKWKDDQDLRSAKSNKNGDGEKKWHDEHQLSGSEDDRIPKSDVWLSEYYNKNPLYVLPANEDPRVPSSDILSIDPITLEVTHVDEIPVLDKWVIDYAEDDLSVEDTHETNAFDKDIYCGNQVYNPRNQTCCKLPNSQARVWDNPKRLRMGCCGIKGYNTELEWCCEGSTKVIRAQWSAGKACCGPQGLPFHYLKHKCCPGNIKSYLVPIPPNDAIGNSAAYSCCTVGNSTQPPIIYKDLHQVCCNGIVSSLLGRGTVCCGTKPYKLRTSSCCAGKYIYNSSSEVKCCRKKKLYNSRTHVCCSAGAVVKPSPMHNGCCNNTPYKPADFKCCRDWATRVETLSPKKYLFESCCGGISYNTQEKICCNSQVVSRKKKYAAICRASKDNRGKGVM